MSLALAERPETDNSTEVDELVATFKREYALGAESARNAVGHWINAGEALLRLRDQLGMNDDDAKRGEFRAWLEENLVISREQGQRCMRMAFYRSVIEERGATTVHAAREIMVGLPAIGKGLREPLKEELKSSVLALRDAGCSTREISETLGISTASAWRIVNPEGAAALDRRRIERRQKAKEEAERREQARLQKLVRQRGGSIAEAYSLVRKLAQELDRAMEGVCDPQAKAEIRRALGRVHSAEDDIVRALKIA